MSISLSPDSKSFVSGACNASTKVSVVLLTFKNMKILEGTLAMHDWSGAPKLNSNTIMAARFAEALLRSRSYKRHGTETNLLPKRRQQADKSATV